MLTTRPAASAFVLAMACSLLAAFVACSDDSTPGTPGAGDGGSGGGGSDAATEAAPVNVTNDKESKQVGRILRANADGEVVPNATITIAGKTVTTDSAGAYEILVPRNQPYQMAVSAEGYYRLLEQEWIVKKETHTRGDTQFLSGSSRTS